MSEELRIVVRPAQRRSLGIAAVWAGYSMVVFTMAAYATLLLSMSSWEPWLFAFVGVVTSVGSWRSWRAGRALHAVVTPGHIDGKTPDLPDPEVVLWRDDEGDFVLEVGRLRKRWARGDGDDARAEAHAISDVVGFPMVEYPNQESAILAWAARLRAGFRSAPDLVNPQHYRPAMCTMTLDGMDLTLGSDHLHLDRQAVTGRGQTFRLEDILDVVLVEIPRDLSFSVLLVVVVTRDRVEVLCLQQVPRSEDAPLRARKVGEFAWFAREVRNAAALRPPVSKDERAAMRARLSQPRAT